MSLTHYSSTLPLHYTIVLLNITLVIQPRTLTSTCVWTQQKRSRPASPYCGYIGVGLPKRATLDISSAILIDRLRKSDPVLNHVKIVYY